MRKEVRKEVMERLISVNVGLPRVKFVGRDVIPGASIERNEPARHNLAAS